MWNILARFRNGDCARNRQQLSAYLDRQLSSEELHRVEQHLTDCHSCQEELRSLKATVALLRRLPQVTPSRNFRIAGTEPSRRWAPVPALRLAMVGAAMLLILAFTADMVNFFDTPLSPVGQEGTNFSYNDNRSAAIWGDKEADAGTLTPSDGQELGPSSDEVLGSTEAAWVRPLEYGLAGLVVVLGGVTAWLWLKPKRRTGPHLT